MNQFIGIWWSGLDGDMKLVGDKGKGYRSLSWSLPNNDAPVMQDIKKLVVDAGKSQLNKDAGEFDWVFYQRGVLISAFLAEGVRGAQAHFNTKVVDREQLRWGLENLNFDEAKIKALGLDGMIAPFKTSCANHTGHSGAWMLEWDGAKFVKASELLTADRATIDELVKVKAKEYADANQPWPTQTCQ
jgi:branched-chain amino acid transport system substrate-binding protein